MLSRGTLKGFWAICTGVMLLLPLSGCATRQWVREQMLPLDQRLTTTERRLKCAASSERHSQRTERATVRSATVARLSEVGWQKEKGPGSLRGFDCRWRTSGQRPLIAFSLALLEQIATNFWLNDGAVAKGRRSTLRLGRHNSQLFWSQCPISGALNFGPGLKLSGSLARYAMARI